VAEHIEALEDVMIRTAGTWGIRAERNPANRGVWVGGRKLGSVGIAIRHGISFHGMAFNVNVSLEPFDWINPCGLKGVSMTSMERELGSEVSMDRVRETMKRFMETAYGVEFVMTDVSDLYGLWLKAS
jgi:lipoate-protein ligase B